VRAILSLLLLALPFSSTASAQTPADEAAIRKVIDTWYAALLASPVDPDLWRLHAPGFIDGGPFGTETRPQSAARSPMMSNELAAKALKFSYEIDLLKVDPRFARAMVWERGYFYAWSAKQTYENAASATFIFEKQADGNWLILAHEATSQGIPPNKVTNPLPDMKPLWDKQNPNGPPSQ
jgi:hypothetical protein